MRHAPAARTLPERNPFALPLAVLGVWTAYGAILFTQARLLAPPDLPRPWRAYGPFLYWFGHAWCWAALTAAIALLVRRTRGLRRGQLAAVHLLALLIAHVIAGVVDAGTMYFIRKSFLASFPDLLTRGIGQSALLYSTVVLGVLALDHARLAKTRAVQAARLETDLQRAKLETLRRQLQPHFLFNTLNTIAALIETDPERAGAMVSRLGDLLRRSLDDQEHAWIPLEAELEFLRLYTEIEQVRFEGWLTVRHEVDPALGEAWVPPMILQPLVENAIRHGISPLRRAGTVSIRAVRDDQRVRLEVIDDGAGMHAASMPAGSGIGLGTTRARLEHLFGAAAHLCVEPRPGGGTTARIVLPLIRVQPAPGSA